MYFRVLYRHDEESGIAVKHSPMGGRGSGSLGVRVKQRHSENSIGRVKMSECYLYGVF